MSWKVTVCAKLVMLYVFACPFLCVQMFQTKSGQMMLLYCSMKSSKEMMHLSLSVLITQIVWSAGA